MTHPSDLHAQLFFPAGTSAPAFLSFSRDGIEVTVELAPRIARILTVLDDARVHDATLGVNALARGWRRRAWIAVEVEHATEYPIEPDTVTSYVSKLLRALSKMKSIFPILGEQVIERRPKLGYRLPPTFKLTIVEG